MLGALGRRPPADLEHVRRFPFAALSVPTPTVVNRTLRLPGWHWNHDQGREGSCVGHGVAMERAITNTAQNRLLAILTPSRRYDPLHIWNEAKKIDEWPDTNPGDDEGTSVRAAYDVMRDRGPRRVYTMRLGSDGVPYPVAPRSTVLADGAAVNRWATTVDEMRASLLADLPVAIGVNWYSAFDAPEAVGSELWIGRGDLGVWRGGHCVCIYGASDKRQAFRVKNSWGRGYPLVWLPYGTMQRLLDEYGEAAIVTDR